MKKFCPLLVEFITVDGDKDMKNLCLNWLNIAFNVCLDKAFGSTAQQGRLLRWLVNLITLDAFIKPSQEIDADYSLFSQRPHNLSMCECSELMQTIYDNFLQSSLAEETFGKPVEKSNDNNTMWITDAFLTSYPIGSTRVWRHPTWKSHSPRTNRKRQKKASTLYHPIRKSRSKKLVKAKKLLKTKKES